MKRAEYRAIFSDLLVGVSASFRQQDMIFRGRLRRAAAFMGSPRSQDSTIVVSMVEGLCETSFQIGSRSRSRKAG